MSLFNKNTEKKNKKGTWSDGMGSLLLAIGIALTIRWGLIEAYVIPSGSMLPSLLIHDHIFVNKFVYGLRVPFTKTWLTRFQEPKRGEVLVFKYPEDEGTFFIKRIVGLPGDVVRYEDGNLFINDEKIEKAAPTPQDEEVMVWVDKDLPGGVEDYIHYIEKLGDHPHSALLRRGWPRQPPLKGPITVKEGHLFVMGDNRDNSDDSRRWGLVPYENIVGRAMFVWLSCNETMPVLTFLCNPITIRWKRFFHSIH